jgi:hypothetical protein
MSDLLQARALLVAVLGERAQQGVTPARERLVGVLKGQVLASWRASRLAEFPKSYYIGQEYVECATKIRCRIEALFVYAGAIASVRFWHNKSEVTLEQTGPFLRVTITRAIPKRLWDDLRLGVQATPHLFVAAYLNAMLPEVNRRLLAVRHDQGHLLSRTFHCTEAVELLLRFGKDALRLHWPQPVTAFAPTAQLAPTIKQLYVRELIDAMHAVLRGELDECVRRLITSAEDFFRARGWHLSQRSGLFNRLLVTLRLRSKSKRNSFRQSLSFNVDASSLPGSVLVPNMLAVYEVRNRIVHAGLRLHPSAKTFCYKAISTLRHIIDHNCGDATVAKFVYLLEHQLSLLLNHAGAGFNLDDIAKYMPSQRAPARPTELKDLNEVLFNALRFTERDLASVR